MLEKGAYKSPDSKCRGFPMLFFFLHFGLYLSRLDEV